MDANKNIIIAENVEKKSFMENIWEKTGKWCMNPKYEPRD